MNKVAIRSFFLNLFPSPWMMDTRYWMLVEDPVFSGGTGRIQGLGSFCQVVRKKKDRSDVDL